MEQSDEAIQGTQRTRHRTSLAGTAELDGFVTLAMTKKGKRNADKRTVHPPHLAMRLASSGMRSPVGVPPRLSPGGLLIPKAQSRAMLPGTRPERSVRYGRPNRGAETSRCSTGVSRAAPVPVQRSTSRAGHSAGRMMPEPPGSQGDEPRPAGTALAPSVGVTGDVP